MSLVQKAARQRSVQGVLVSDAINSCREMLRKGQSKKCEKAAQQYLRSSPGNLDLMAISAQAALAQNKIARAAGYADAVLSIDPTSDDAALVKSDCIRFTQGIDAAIFFLAQSVDNAPSMRLSRIRLARLCIASNNFVGALASIQPVMAQPDDDGEVFELAGWALRALNRVDEADQAFDLAIKLNPRRIDAIAQRVGIAEFERGQDTRPLLKRSLKDNPGNQALLILYLHSCQKRCDWSDFEAMAPQGTDLLSLGQEPGSSSPWMLLSFFDDALASLKRSRVFARSNLANAGLKKPADRPKFTSTAGRRIRIGYFSNDYHNHATLKLISGVLRNHDRTRFELHCYDYGGTDDEGIELKQEFDVVNNVRDAPNESIVALARSSELDIAVDLKGYTRADRTPLFLQGLAPVQINYVGYPGTLGSRAYDYMVADDIVVPKHLETYFDEEIIRLPTCYLPYDDTRRPMLSPPRTALGLPEDAVVLACHNQAYKICREAFSIWLETLAAQPETVLWLLHDNDTATANVKAEASSAGIAPERIIFAPKVPHADHISRLSQADLYLDTFNYNSHTLSADSICSAGLPLLTKAGQQFSARVGASFITAAGLPELVTNTNQEYSDKLKSLAGNRALLAELRQKLAVNRAVRPIFSTKKYTRLLEAAYLKSVEIAQTGSKPQSFSVPALTDMPDEA